MPVKKGKKLLSDYIKGTSGKSERNLVEYWYARQLFKHMQGGQPEEYDRIKAEIWAELDVRTPGRATKAVKLWPRLAMVAAALATVIFGVWMFNGDTGMPKPGKNTLAVNDIAPGKNTAVLTFANGKHIKLSDSKAGVVMIGDDLQYNDNTAVISSEEKNNQTEEMTLTTPRGGTYYIILSDGTKVWLNAASSLTYTAALNKQGKRLVKLDGEAYFEVAKDKQHPFVVMSTGQEVEVLGTHFNISSYQEEGVVKTTLLEGAVKVTGQHRAIMHKDFSEVLKPGQQAVLAADKFEVLNVNTEQVIAWKNGEFAFQKQELTEVMRSLSRWYNVDVAYQPGFKDILFTGSVSRFEKISTVLRLLELTGEVKFKIEGRRITVMR